MIQPNPGAQRISPLTGSEFVDILGVEWGYTTTADIAGLTNSVVSNIAALRALPANPSGVLIYVEGYFTAGDGGQGFFLSTLVPNTDDGGYYISSNTPGYYYVRQVSGYISPEMWGAVGDGSTDCYLPLKHMIAYVNSGGCNQLEFGVNKTYFINQYILSGNGITELPFQSVDGLTINGNGSTIQSRGGFNRAVVGTGTVMVLFFDGCTNLIVRNITYNGGSQTITHSGGVTESPSGYGINLCSCVNVLLENVTSTYCITDGFVLQCSSRFSNPQITCQNVKLVNCVSTYNARQGISIVQGYGVVCDNCDFSYTGKAAYGVHAPGLGIDVEPGATTGTAPPNQVNFDTQDILFLNCRVHYNASGFFGLSNTDGYVQQVTFLRCNMIQNAADSPNATIGTADINQASFLYNYFDLGLSYFSNGVTPFVSQSSIWQGNYFTGTGSIMLSVENIMPILIKDNNFISTASTPFNQVHQAIIWNTSSFQLTFTGNYIYIPGAAYSAQSGAYDSRTVVQLWFVKLAENNTYQTNLNPAVGAHGSANFAVDYSGNLKVQNETFIGFTRGTGDSFQPGLNFAFNTNFPYSTGYTNVGDTLIMGFSDQSLREVTGSAAPTTSAWNKGDRCINTNPTEAGAGGSKYVITGWVCTAAGTPGTWLQTRTLTGN